MKSEIRFNHAGLQFAVKNVPASVKFYKKVLGFEIDYENGSPVEYAVVFRDEVYIHICLQKNQPYEIGPGCGFVSVSGVEKLWEHVFPSGAEIIQPLTDKDYGHGVLFRDFTIKDSDGNVLRIGQQAKFDK